MFRLVDVCKHACMRVSLFIFNFTANSMYICINVYMSINVYVKLSLLFVEEYEMNNMRRIMLSIYKV